jgi:hypothetical protein
LGQKTSWTVTRNAIGGFAKSVIESGPVQLIVSDRPEGTLKMSQFASMLMLASLLVVLGCEQKLADRTPEKVTSKDVRRDANQAAATAVEFSEQTKEEFLKKLDTELKQSDAELAKLREKGLDLKDDAKATWEQKMAVLETKRDPRDEAGGKHVVRRLSVRARPRSAEA